MIDLVHSSENEEFIGVDSNSPTMDDLLSDEPTIKDHFEALPFESSAEMLATIDNNIQLGHDNGGIDLYPWQLEESEKLCFAKPNSQEPFKYCLCAANGSGKDAFVIAPFAVFFAATKVRSLVIITSSSGVQLSNQTESYISSVAEKLNKWGMAIFGRAIFKIRKRHITCLLTGSHILLFATDEEGKAEGYHPLEPNAEMAIIVNEAKSVAPEIFRALRRCTGYNYWLNVSTPGEPLGDFFRSWSTWPNKRKITVFDCPHQSRSEFDAEKKELGENNPLFKSKWLAEFSYIGGKYVIGTEAMERLKNKLFLDGVTEFAWDSKIRIGLDIALSGNGDETVITGFRGNRQLRIDGMRIQDVVQLTDNIESLLIQRYKLDSKAPETYEINADDGGVGRAVITLLQKRGWEVSRILNQSASLNKKNYRNRGAELWYKFARMVEDQLIILLDDPKQYEQISGRKFKVTTGGLDKLQLEGKKESLANGTGSPDRADATVLAFARVNLEMLLNKRSKVIEYKPAARKQTYQELEGLLENMVEGQKHRKVKRFISYSVKTLVEKEHRMLTI